MLLSLSILSVLVAMIIAAAVWRARLRRRSPQKGPEVIYLGYEDQENVGSMRAALLERIERGDLEGR